MKVTLSSVKREVRAQKHTIERCTKSGMALPKSSRTVSAVLRLVPAGAKAALK